MKLTTVLFLALFSTSSIASDAHYQAAKTHVGLVQQAQENSQMVDSLVLMITMTNPALQGYGDILTNFYTDMMASDEFLEAQVELYQRNYTQAELEFMNEVLANPLMQSYQKKQPAVMQEGMLLAQRFLEQNQDKLMNEILIRQQELKSEE